MLDQFLIEQRAIFHHTLMSMNGLLHHHGMPQIDHPIPGGLHRPNVSTLQNNAESNQNNRPPQLVTPGLLNAFNTDSPLSPSPSQSPSYQILHSISPPPLRRSPSVISINSSQSTFWMPNPFDDDDDDGDSTVEFNEYIEPEELIISTVHSNAFTQSKDYVSTNAVLMMDDETLEKNRKLYDAGIRCGACIDVVHPLFMSKCGHYVCASCISRWIVDLKNKKCPSCRQATDLNDYFRSYSS